jgi:hypothetical protein
MASSDAINGFQIYLWMKKTYRSPGPRVQRNGRIQEEQDQEGQMKIAWDKL